MKKILVNGCLTMMIVILCLAVIAYIWSIWEHQQTLYFYCEATGRATPRTGWDSVNLLSPTIGFFILFVIVPITGITALVRRKILKSEMSKGEISQDNNI